MSKRKKQGKNSGKIKIAVLLVLVIIGVAFAAPSLFKTDGEGAASGTESKTPFKKEEPVELSISCVGDIMVHSPQIPSQYNSATGTYDYNNNFEYIKSYITASDLALCNVETTFAGGTYSGYPMFNAPEALADAIKNAGWDVGMTANNHNMDTGLSGMKRTLEILRKAGLETTGTRLADTEKNYVIMPVKGVNIAVVSYTYETGGTNGGKAINGIGVPQGSESLLNSFSYTTMDEDAAQIKQTMDAARSDGADIVIAYMHWGEEYQNSPNDYQLNLARRLADSGADIIFASHPHVIQGAEMLTNEQTGKQVPVFYSMGNFISNQRVETLDMTNSRFTEQGIIAQVKLEYMKSTKEILTIQMDAVPTWVDKYRSGGKDVYAVVPLDENMNNNLALAASGHLSRAQQALADITQTLGAQ